MMVGLVPSAVSLCCIVLQSGALRAHEGVGGAVDIVLRTLHARTDSSSSSSNRNSQAHPPVSQRAGRQPNRREWSAACVRWASVPVPAPVPPFTARRFPLLPTAFVRRPFPRQLTDRPQSKQFRLDFFLANSLTAISGFIFDSVSGGALDMAADGRMCGWMGCSGEGLAERQGAGEQQAACEWTARRRRVVPRRSGTGRQRMAEAAGRRHTPTPAHGHCTARTRLHDTRTLRQKTETNKQKQQTAQTTTKSTPLQNEKSCISRIQCQIRSSERKMMHKQRFKLVRAITLA